MILLYMTKNLQCLSFHTPNRRVLNRSYEHTLCIYCDRSEKLISEYQHNIELIKIGNVIISPSIVWRVHCHTNEMYSLPDKGNNTVFS